MHFNPLYQFLEAARTVVLYGFHKVKTIPYICHISLKKTDKQDNNNPIPTVKNNMQTKMYGNNR